MPDKNNSKSSNKAKKGKAKHAIRYLSLNEWKKLREIEKNKRDELVLRILYETGCTVNELVSIKKKDFDFSKGILTIYAENSRNHESRIAHVSKGLIALVKEYIKSTRNDAKKSEYLFATRQSKAMTTKRARQIVHKYCNMVGIETNNPQVIRYTHIVHAYLKGIPFNAIASQVGLKRSRAIEIFSQLPDLAVNNSYNKFFN